MKKLVVAFGILLALSACGDPPRTAEPAASKKMDDGDVALVAVAPDGTKLWAVNAYGRTVFFASTGTQETHSCGKGCQRTVNVPSVPQP